MSEVFSRRAELGVKLAVLALVFGLAAGIVFWMSRLHAVDLAGVPPAQPIAFSHKHHVGDIGLDCRYCHSTVETATFAGMPATDTCLTCHSQLFVDAPLLAPLHRSAATGLPIAWSRLHKLPDFVYFDHSIHIAKGVGCVECHGRVDQMPLEWRSAPLQMQWCLDCHRDPRPHLRPHDQVYSMLPAAAASAPPVTLQSTQRLTDCSTCHR